MQSPVPFLCALGLITMSGLADGPADNRPDAVRRVPPPGAAISDLDRQELQQGVKDLGNVIDELQTSLKGKPTLAALLPDVQIFHNAVRYALQYDEFFNPTNEVAA